MKIIHGIVITFLIFLLFTHITSGNPVEELNYRWRNDDGDIYSATWKDSINFPITLTNNENIRLRFKFRPAYGETTYISLGYKEGSTGSSWIPISRSDTGKFILSPSRYISDSMAYNDNGLLPREPWEENIPKSTTITLDSSCSYYLTSPTTNSIYEFEFSLKPTANIMLGTSYFFSLFKDGKHVEFNEYAVLITQPVSWIPQHFGNIHNPTYYDFYNLSFIDENTGTILCNISDFTILRTTNGGTTWIRQNIQVEGKDYSGFNAACFTSADTGTLIGNEGIIVRTTNGGKEWIRQPSPTTYSLNSVCFTSKDTGTVVGSLNAYHIISSIILRTTNGGTNWIYQVFPNQLYHSVHFADADNGFVVGENGAFLKTTDGGQNWTAKSSGTKKYLADVFFTDKNNGIAVGDGILLKTMDGGNTWLKVLDDDKININSVHFINKNTGWAVGDSGCILKTTDGGSNWKKLVSCTMHNLNAIQFVNDKTGWAVGSMGSILKSASGGDIATFIDEKEIQYIPKDYYLSQNYPNPFNPSTTIKYSIPKAAFVSICIYDILGKELTRLVNEVKPSGNYEINWNAANLPSGVYFYQIITGNFIQSKKMALIR